MGRPQVGGQAFPAQSGGILEDAVGWARQQLMIDGCDLLGKFYVPHVQTPSLCVMLGGYTILVTIIIEII